MVEKYRNLIKIIFNKQIASKKLQKYKKNYKLNGILVIYNCLHSFEVPIHCHDNPLPIC